MLVLILLVVVCIIYGGVVIKSNLIKKNGVLNGGVNIWMFILFILGLYWDGCIVFNGL